MGNYTLTKSKHSRAKDSMLDSMSSEMFTKTLLVEKDVVDAIANYVTARIATFDLATDRLPLGLSLEDYTNILGEQEKDSKQELNQIIDKLYEDNEIRILKFLAFSFGVWAFPENSEPFRAALKSFTPKEMDHWWPAVILTSNKLSTPVNMIDDMTWLFEEEIMTQRLMVSLYSISIADKGHSPIINILKNYLSNMNISLIKKYEVLVGLCKIQEEAGEVYPVTNFHSEYLNELRLQCREQLAKEYGFEDFPESWFNELLL